jgi:hypothetical protein
VRRAEDLRIVPPISSTSVDWSHLSRLHHSDTYLQWLQSYKEHSFEPCQISGDVPSKKPKKKKNMINVPNNNSYDIHNTSSKLSNAAISIQPVNSDLIHDDHRQTPCFVNRTPSELLEMDQLNIILHVDVHLYLKLNNLFVKPSRSDGHCLMHSWSTTTGKSLLEIQDIIANEFILKTVFYRSFGITEEDLALYLSDHQHTLQSVDAVLNILCNATNTTAVVIGQQFKFVSDPNDESILNSEPVLNVTEFRQIKPVSNQSTNTVFLLKTGLHYDAILDHLVQ